MLPSSIFLPGRSSPHVIVVALTGFLPASVQVATSRYLTAVGNGTAVAENQDGLTTFNTQHGSESELGDGSIGDCVPYKAKYIETTQFPLIVMRRFSVVITVPCEQVASMRLDYKQDSDSKSVQWSAGQCRGNHYLFHDTYSFFSSVDGGSIVATWNRTDGAVMRVHGSWIDG